VLKMLLFLYLCFFESVFEVICVAFNVCCVERVLCCMCNALFNRPMAPRGFSLGLGVRVSGWGLGLGVRVRVGKDVG
jgi:hypothetical protein